MVINGILLGFLTFLSLLSVRYIPPVDTTGIFGAEPVFVLFIGYFVLKEKFGKFEVIVTVAMFTGIIMVCQPQFIFGHGESGYNELIGIGLSVASTIMISIVDCMCRMLKLSDGMFLSLIQAMGAVLFTLVALGFRMTQMPTLYQWIYIFGAGLAGVTGRISVTFAMKFEKASYISSVVAVEVILTVILQIFILGIYPNTLSISGSVLVASCIVLLSFRVQVVDKLEKIFCSSINDEPATDSLKAIANDNEHTIQELPKEQIQDEEVEESEDSKSGEESEHDSEYDYYMTTKSNIFLGTPSEIIQIAIRDGHTKFDALVQLVTILMKYGPKRPDYYVLAEIEERKAYRG
ncbi:putative transport protein [Nymphon striatum]|nr:putative transport protein [Nymphon striatum]